MFTCFKKLPPGSWHRQRSFLSSPYYFPEQTVISSIFHAYGHECLVLPYLNVNKKGISCLWFSLEGREGVKTSSEIWCVSHCLTQALCGSCPLPPFCLPMPEANVPPVLCARLLATPRANKEVSTFAAASFSFLYQQYECLKSWASFLSRIRVRTMCGDI